MIGKKKLSTIRNQISKTFGPTGADPIRSLERQLSSIKSKGSKAEVIDGLKQFLESPRRGKRRGKTGVGAAA